MIGIIFAIIASFFEGSINVLTKHLLRVQNSVSLMFIAELIGTIFLLPFFLYSFHTIEVNLWILPLVSGLLWGVAMLLYYVTLKELEVSVQGILFESRTFLVMVFAILFLGEVLTSSRLLGTVLIVGGITLVLFRRIKTFSIKGLICGIISLIVGGVAMIIDKYALQFFEPLHYIFYLYAIPTLMLLPFIFTKKRMGEIKKMYSQKWIIITIGIGHAAVYIFVLLAFQFSDILVIKPLLEINVVIATIGGIIFLKEREDIWQKVVGMSIAICGAIVIALF